MEKNCREFASKLNDYVDGELEPGLCEEIEKHIGSCENCRIMVDTMKKTVTLCCAGKEVSLPADLEERLNNLLKARWEKKFGKK
jgi:anti-sigma factor RsiW